MQRIVSASHSLLSSTSLPLGLKRKSLSTRTRLKDEAQPLDCDEVLSLCSLPHDVLLLILGFLDARALLICKGVSRLFRSLINADMLLTYRIELAINGMIDGLSSSGLTISERLDKLRQYSQRYCTGQFTLDTEMKLGRIGLGDFSRLMAPWDSRNLQTDSFGGTVCFELIDGDERSLAVYAPPSIIEGTPPRHWTIPLQPPTGKRILAVDATQDLVVAIAPVLGAPRTAQFSLSSLESGGTAFHPLAEEPMWEILSDGHPSLEIMDTQIFGPYIAWKTPWPNDYGMAEDHLQVRNWKTGRKVWDDHMRHIASYTFIDASYLLVVFPSAVGSFPGHLGRGRPDLIRIYRIQGEPVGPLATLQLPQDLELTTMLNPSVPCPPTPPSSAAFWPDPERRIVVLRLLSWYSPFHTIIRMLRPSTSHWSWHNMLLIIPCTTFHEQIKRASSTQDSGSTPASSIPWEEWGLRGSVLIRQDNFENTQRTRNWLSPSVFPYGSRLTFFVPSSGGSGSGGSPQLVTLDANSLSKLHPPHSGCTRRDALASVEKSSDRGLSSILKTTRPRTYYV